MRRIKDFAVAELTGNSDSIKDLLHEYTSSRYPGKTVLETGKKLLEQIEKTKDIKAFYDLLQAEKEALLDYEEDVQDVKKFFKNQRTIFDKALKMLGIYEGNRSYVLDAETIKFVDEMEKIIRAASPYSEIHKLPELIEKFMNRFVKLLEEECVPIKASIETDFEATKQYMEHCSSEVGYMYKDKINKDFNALFDRLSRANNIYEAIAMQTESDRMKQRFIESLINEQTRIEAKKDKPVGDAPTPIYRKIKTLSAKSLFGSGKQIANKDDIDQLLDEIRVKLEKQLEEDTTIQIV